MKMKNKNKTYCLLASLALFLTACWQKSLEPFYTEKDLTANPALIGTWTESTEKPDDKPAIWTFKQSGEKRYLLNVVDSDVNVDFDARLFKLGDSHFLDLASRKRELFVIPAHHLLKVSIKADALEMKLLSLDWIKNWISLHPRSLSHIRINDPEEPDNTDKMETVLTAKTADLQKFILEHQNDENFFEGGATLKRTAK